MVNVNDIKIFIDPTSKSYYKNRLFDEKNNNLNRDNCLLPFIYLKKFLESKGYSVFTADYLSNGSESEKLNIYISLGVVKNYRKLALKRNVILNSFFIFEPLVVAPELYKNIKRISTFFKNIFLHNTSDELSEYIDKTKNIHKFYWPQTENSVIESLWGNKKRKFLTLINANKKPVLAKKELYRERIRAIEFFSQYNDFDLYGYGWRKHILYWPYLLNRKSILKCYKGSIKSKYEMLAQYNFALCFENMIFEGYVTEKIFDCFFTGTIPVYLGAPDITNYVPKECFIDMREFSDYSNLREYLQSLTENEIQQYRENARIYLSSEKYKLFTKESFAKVILDVIEKDV
ncbi:MAG: glycosyltransferase family 10 [Candidatus Omnitrophica bacterium]|nr:glycosyltransferase family 10 [Candidatus Omnitrophota bacterium]